MSNTQGQSWTETFFTDWPLPDWINAGHEDKQDVRLFNPQKKWMLGRSADTGRYSEFGRIQGINITRPIAADSRVVFLSH
ncbi:uncharacterized protein BO87DRAFT_110039 [Aspergillus neoniger CBS 115656]|uniref:Uncharacterized protein n=1 Tax=Aspergillus neoniger (strain CBS 115656) TaxID=1448310 RepID=A0A318Z6F6_ASPNB|nr:hypothetical protein BO87DRAFT_110039 [Aspergillus neoniger CBS 115656]PYH32462.1 hypothetical protein BO87DRAFT_110039 [Aspergillus neoniger CBS 115656]